MDDRNRCSSCEHWNQLTNWDYDNAINSGTCTEVRDGMEIELQTGWDGGYVKSIETEGNFGCVFHILKLKKI